MTTRRQNETPGIVGRSDVPLVIVFAPDTPDRTAAIRRQGPSPWPHLKESARLLELMGASTLGVPCNAAHHFLRQASAGTGWCPSGRLVDMIEEVAAQVAAAGVRVVGLLATTGTITTGLYQNALAGSGTRVLTLEQEAGRNGRPAERHAERQSGTGLARHGARPLAAHALQALVTHLVSERGEQDGLVMEAIYGQAGIKAGITNGLPRQLLHDAARRLVDRGAEALILGCTEIPLVLRGSHMRVDGRMIPLIDATTTLAASLRAGSGTIGIAGGLGPEATIDLVAKLNAPRDFVDTLHGLFAATIEELKPEREQDHLRMYAAALPDPVDAARRVTLAGATVLAISPNTFTSSHDLSRATGLPVVVGPVGEVSRFVVRAARQGLPPRR